MKKFINYNGTIYEEGQPVLTTADHSYRYGDGLFETMKMVKKDLLLKHYHFERLYSGLKILKFNAPSSFTRQSIQEQIEKLCQKNGCEGLARIRLSVSRGNGGLYDCDNKFSYTIECRSLEQHALSENGLTIDIFPDARKSIDIFSNLKSANYLPYTMAAIWAKESNLDDALILNCRGRICDATIANVFWVKDEKIFTPPLNEGCVSGVMRRRIIELHGSVVESVLTEDTLLAADELFLSNVTTGLRWVKQFRNKIYRNTVASKLFAETDQTK